MAVRLVIYRQKTVGQPLSPVPLTFWVLNILQIYQMQLLSPFPYHENIDQKNL